MRLSILAFSALGALVLAAAAHGGPSSHGGRQLRVTVDPMLIARHRALGRLSQPHAFTDPAVIARHAALAQLGSPATWTDRALIARHRAPGLLPDLSVNKISRPMPTGSTGLFPWNGALIGVAAATACLLIGLVVARAGRLRIRASARDV